MSDILTRLNNSITTQKQYDTPYSSSCVVSETHATITIVVPIEHLEDSLKPGDSGVNYLQANLKFTDALIDGWAIKPWVSLLKDKEGNVILKPDPFSKKLAPVKSGRGLWVAVREEYREPAKK